MERAATGASPYTRPRRPPASRACFGRCHAGRPAARHAAAAFRGSHAHEARALVVVLSSAPTRCPRRLPPSRKARSNPLAEAVSSCAALPFFSSAAAPPDEKERRRVSRQARHRSSYFFSLTRGLSTRGTCPARAQRERAGVRASGEIFIGWGMCPTFSVSNIPSFSFIRTHGRHAVPPPPTYPLKQLVNTRRSRTSHLSTSDTQVCSLVELLFRKDPRRAGLFR